MEFAAGVYLSEAQTPYPSSPYTYCVYSILIHTEKGGGGRVEPEKKGEEQQRRVQQTKSREFHQIISVTSISRGGIILQQIFALAAAGADLRAPEVDETEDEAEGHQGHQQAQDDQDALQRVKIERESGFLSSFFFLLTGKHNPKRGEREYLHM
jgi:hypothetical protein